MSVIVNPLTKMVPNVKAPEGIRWTLNPQIRWAAGMQRRRPGLLFQGTVGTDPWEAILLSSPVVITAVLEVDQHEAVSVFWL